jgi:DNA-binding transcriptional regulator LsrR (DeoR family)
MTPRQTFILKKLKEGISQSEISKQLGVSKRTIYVEVEILRNVGKIEIKREYRSPIHQSNAYAGIEDITLKKATGVKFTEEQLKVYEQNSELPRKQLSKLMGIDRLTLNFMIEKTRENDSSNPKNYHQQNALTRQDVIDYLKAGMTQKEVCEKLNVRRSLVFYYRKKLEANNEIKIQHT